MGLETILIILGISLGAGMFTVEYQKARTDPPPFQSPSDAPVFDGDIKITPAEKVNI